MFVPLHDENSLKAIRFQWVTIILIAINIVVYFFESARLDEVAIAGFAIIPKELFDTSLLPIATETVGPALPERLTLLTYMFFHGDILHLAGNMLFLWVFGDNVEDAMGHIKFLIFYLACGVLAGLVHAWMDPSSEIPLIGASGAVAGVIAAYLVLHPRVRVWVLALKAIPLRISAFLRARTLDRDPGRHGDAAAGGSGRLVGAHRWTDCGRGAGRLPAPPRGCRCSTEGSVPEPNGVLVKGVGERENPALATLTWARTARSFLALAKGSESHVPWRWLE